MMSTLAMKQNEKITARQAQRWAAEQLLAAGIDTAMLDARLLVVHVLQTTQEQLIANADAMMLSDADWQALERMVNERTRAVPMAYILGEKEFYGFRFAVRPGVLIPRPDSEILVEAALKTLNAKGAPTPRRILDWGVGSGALLLSVLSHMPKTTGVGYDISDIARQTTRQNIHTLHLQNRTMVVSEKDDAAMQQPFDAILANPPYIPTREVATLMADVKDHEPHLALDGGVDGLEIYRELFPFAAQKLSPTGHLWVEYGQGQAAQVAALAAQSGLTLRAVHKDLAGIERVSHFQLMTTTV